MPQPEPRVIHVHLTEVDWIEVMYQLRKIKNDVVVAIICDNIERQVGRGEI
jgi:hypothetical protein